MLEVSCPLQTPAGRTRRNVLRLAAILIAIPLLALLTACGSDNAGSPDVLIESLAPTSTPEGFLGGPTNGNGLHGLTFPIAGACLPKGDQLMPNAARPYRNGIHEGVDFYAVDNCTAITVGTPVLAVQAGRVIRADLSYRDPTPAEISAYLANPNTETSLDQFRGRQVWLDHGRGVVTRYAHLASIAPGIINGASVSQGQLIAGVGESGTPESVSNPGREYHLHFEVRIGTGCVAPTAQATVNCSYLGKDEPPADVRRIYSAAFSP